MLRLDRTQPFGEVFGDHFAKFVQEGVFFDQSGREIVTEDSPVIELPTEPRQKRKYVKKVDKVDAKKGQYVDTGRAARL